MRNVGLVFVGCLGLSIWLETQQWGKTPLLWGLTAASAVWFAARLTRLRGIDYRLERVVGRLSRLSAFRRTLPSYRFVDVYRALCVVADELPGAVRIDSQHAEDLSAILCRRFYSDANRHGQRPEQISRQVGPGEEKFFPADVFFAVPADTVANVPAAVFRVHLMFTTGELLLEVGAVDPEYAEAAVARVLTLASERSIYRGQMISLAFTSEIRDEYGDVQQSEAVDVQFKRRDVVDDDDIVLDGELKRVVARNTIDFHRSRESLMKLGLPGKRGVLFYGPPGTGKTYMCKYISHHLPDATIIVCAGPSLEHIKSVCNVGRMLQPAVILLEDVDLVFQQRQENIFGATLGQFMDELDGFASQDRMLFILTTNAIERIEAAIKDRPGRISQCVYFGAPTGELRGRYLERHLRPYDSTALDVDALVDATSGATQAFLKEYVFRAVQIASESADADSPESLALRNEHFEAALGEMRDKGGAPADAILGFCT